MSMPVAKPSTRKGKKKMITDKCGRSIHFGFEGMSDFTKHHDQKRRINYYKRHYKTANPDIPAIRQRAKKNIQNCKGTPLDAATYYLW